MHKETRSGLILLTLLIFLSMATANSYFALTGTQIEKVTIQADSRGLVAVQTDNPLIGELKSVIYVNGNYTGSGLISLNYGLPGRTAIDSYNLSSGTVTRAPRIKVAGSTDAYAPYPLFGKLWINLTSGQAWRSATAYIVYG